MKFLIRILIWIYQRIISPPLHWIGGPNSGCRYEPTCSQYFLEAVETFGAIKGSWMGVRRIFRCHPWGGFGFDPVPGSARDLASRESFARGEEEEAAAGDRCGCDRDLGQLTHNAKT